jgi:hypothetical protein
MGIISISGRQHRAEERGGLIFYTFDNMEHCTFSIDYLPICLKGFNAVFDNEKHQDDV